MNPLLPPWAGWALGLLAMLWALPTGAADIEEVEESVVRVLVVGSEEEVFSGSGFVVSPGQVVTNWHVVEHGKKHYVASKQEPDPVPAYVLWAESGLDLAILDVAGLDLPAAVLSGRDLKKGETVWAVGYPGVSDLGVNPSLGATINRGVISNFHRESWNQVIASRPLGQPVEIIQHDAAINPGNSGGPLVDNCGRIAGVNVGGHPTAHGIFLALRITEAFERLRAYGIEFKLAEDQECNGNGPKTTPPSTGTTAGVVPDAVQLPQLPWLWPLLVLSLVAILISFAFWGRKEFFNLRKLIREKNEAKPLPFSQPRQEGKIVLTFVGPDKAWSRPNCEILESSGSVDKGGIVLGRHPELVDELISHRTVSRRHARIFWGQGKCFVEDMNSYRGTVVNGLRLKPFYPHTLSSDDRMLIGEITIIVRRGPG